jgi:hypothetical protein
MLIQRTSFWTWANALATHAIIIFRVGEKAFFTPRDAVVSLN